MQTLLGSGQVPEVVRAVVLVVVLVLVVGSVDVDVETAVVVDSDKVLELVVESVTVVVSAVTVAKDCKNHDSFTFAMRNRK